MHVLSNVRLYLCPLQSFEKICDLRRRIFNAIIVTNHSGYHSNLTVISWLSPRYLIDISQLSFRQITVFNIERPVIIYLSKINLTVSVSYVFVFHHEKTYHHKAMKTIKIYQSVLIVISPSIMGYDEELSNQREIRSSRLSN